MTKVDELRQWWHNILMEDYTNLGEESRSSIVSWLLGESPSRLENLTSKELDVVKQGMEFRYRILTQRYLRVNPNQAYRNLIDRLGKVVILRNKIATWVSMSRDRQRAVADVIQECIQEMLNSDRKIQKEIKWIDQCSKNSRLKNSLLLSAIEEYSLRPIRNQPLLAYRFVNYLRSQERGGMTQVPRAEMLRFISEEVGFDENNNSISLLEPRAIEEYQKNVEWEEKVLLRRLVQEKFENYLESNVGEDALKWLKLYLQGYTQNSIADILKFPIKKVYRLREKVSYHALKVFSLREEPELVANWLKTSLEEHNLGLTLGEWEQLWESITPRQRQIIENVKAGKNLEEICQELKLKSTQVMKEWDKIYLTAQNIRNSTE